MCGKQNLLQLNNHLTQMHGWNSEQKKEYKLNQMGMGLPVVNQFVNEPIEELTDNDVFTDEHTDEEMEDSEISEDEDEIDDDYEYCSDDEENDRVWRKFRNEVVAPYKEIFHERLEKLIRENPDIPVRDLKDAVYEEFRENWVDDAADYLKSIITYYEHFETDGYMEKIIEMRDELISKKEDKTDALTMAINLYKTKLGKLFNCDFDIPE